jgi:threonyl-tRNA synthetase
MIHRALFGSVERFFGILVEHFAGAFPTWLSPIQVRVLPVRDDHQSYADSVAEALVAEGFRVDIAKAEEPLGSRVRKARLEKLPYVLVVGDDDVREATVGVNTRGRERPERGVALRDFISAVKSEIDTGSVSPGELSTASK